MEDGRRLNRQHDPTHSYPNSLVLAVGLFLLSASVALGSTAVTDAAGIVEQIVPSGTIGPWQEEAKVVPDTSPAPGQARDSNHAFATFGSALAIDGDTLVIGTSDDADDPLAAVYIFERSHSDWTEQTQLTPPTPSGVGGFGHAVGVDDDAGTVVVGDPGEDDPGRVLVYERHPVLGWLHTDTLTPYEAPSKGVDTYFGASVDIDDGTIIAGAPAEDRAGQYSGAAYIFDKSGNTWHLQQTLTPTHIDARDGVGWSVGIDGDRLYVSAPADETPNGDGSGVGAVYVYNRGNSGWNEQLRLAAPDPGGTEAPGGDCFGFSAAIDGPRIAVGDPCWDSILDHHGATHNTGKGYIFSVTEGKATLAATLQPLLPRSNMGFGTDIAIDGNDSVIGARGAPGGVGPTETRTGAAFVFEKNENAWALTARLRGTDTSPHDLFGDAVALDEEVIAVGAPFDDNRRDGTPYPINDQGDFPPDVGPVGICLEEDTLPGCDVGEDAGSAYLFTPLNPNIEPQVSFGWGSSTIASGGAR